MNEIERVARAIYDADPKTDHIRYRHYAQASFLLANEIRAGMHLEDEIAETEPAQ